MSETEEPVDPADPPDGQGGGGEDSTAPQTDNNLNLDSSNTAARSADVPDGQSGGGG